MSKKAAAVEFGIWTVLRQAPYKVLGEIPARWVVACAKGHEKTVTGNALHKERQEPTSCASCTTAEAGWRPGVEIGGYTLVEQIGNRKYWKVRCGTSAVPGCGQVEEQKNYAIHKNKSGCFACSYENRHKTVRTYQAFGQALTARQVEAVTGHKIDTILHRAKKMPFEQALVIPSPLVTSPRPVSKAAIRTEKRCSSCRKVKKLAAFHRDRGKVDGHGRECSSCRNRRRRLFYKPQRMYEE